MAPTRPREPTTKSAVRPAGPGPSPQPAAPFAGARQRNAAPVVTRYATLRVRARTGIGVWDARTGDLVTYLSTAGSSAGGSRWSPDGLGSPTQPAKRSSSATPTQLGHAGRGRRRRRRDSAARMVALRTPAGIRWLGQHGADLVGRTWTQLAEFPIGPRRRADATGTALGFHPSEPVSRLSDPASTIDLWEFDADRLLGSAPRRAAERYTTAKVVRRRRLRRRQDRPRLAAGDTASSGSSPRRTASSSGSPTQLANERADGTECEAMLWDLAGQPDYRLIHRCSSTTPTGADRVQPDPPAARAGRASTSGCTRCGHGGRPVDPRRRRPSTRRRRALAAPKSNASAAQRGIAGLCRDERGDGEGLDELVERCASSCRGTTCRRRSRRRRSGRSRTACWRRRRPRGARATCRRS